MSSQSLFLDAPLQFEGAEKLAGMLTRLGDNVDNWPQEITEEAYKRLPYLSDFEPTVVLDKGNEERGYAFGSIEVRPKTGMTTSEQYTSQVDKVHIPIIVKEQMLCPFDVFMHGKKYDHLTEGRLRAALFKPQMFDAARTAPHDPSLVNDLQPPLRSGFGGGSMKMGSAELPLLPQLHGRVRQDDVDRVKEAMDDPSLYTAVANGDEGVRAAFESAMALEVSDPTKTASVIQIVPDTIQFTKLANGKVRVKTANAEAYAPQQQDIPASTAQDAMAQEQDAQTTMEEDGSVTLNSDSAVKQTMDCEEIKVADTFGLWKVQDVNGTTMIGWVFPQLMNLNMTPVPVALFNNGSVHCLQEVICGQMAGKSTDLPKGVPAGYGTLYVLDHGTARAFVPMHIGSTFRGPDGVMKYTGTTESGDRVVFSFSDGLQKVVEVGNSEFIVPSTVNWMPLKGNCELVGDPMMFSKMASKDWTGVAELLGDGDEFSWRGPAVAKLASDQTKFLDRHGAEFLGAALGVEPLFCKEAVSRAAKGELVQFSGLRQVIPISERVKTAQEEAKKCIKQTDGLHRYFLAKEASVLDDALTADKILGLGFLNAENVNTFVEMLPTLEQTLSRLAELLVAIRMGLKDVPEVAVERMLAAMEDVINGLKSLRQRELTFV